MAGYQHATSLNMVLQWVAESYWVTKLANSQQPRRVTCSQCSNALPGVLVVGFMRVCVYAFRSVGFSRSGDGARLPDLDLAVIHLNTLSAA